MDKIYIGRIIDGSDFDRIIAERAFGDADECDAWLAQEHADVLRETEPFYRRAIRAETETMDFIP